jgi:hypothetical protein
MQFGSTPLASLRSAVRCTNGRIRSVGTSLSEQDGYEGGHILQIHLITIEIGIVWRRSAIGMQG